MIVPLQLPFAGETLQELIHASLCVAHEVDPKAREDYPQACDLLDQVSLMSYNRILSSDYYSLASAEDAGGSH